MQREQEGALKSTDSVPPIYTWNFGPEKLFRVTYSMSPNKFG